MSYFNTPPTLLMNYQRIYITLFTCLATLQISYLPTIITIWSSTYTSVFQSTYQKSHPSSSLHSNKLIRKPPNIPAYEAIDNLPSISSMYLPSHLSNYPISFTYLVRTSPTIQHSYLHISVHTDLHIRSYTYIHVEKDNHVLMLTLFNYNPQHTFYIEENIVFIIPSVYLYARVLLRLHCYKHLHYSCA